MYKHVKFEINLAFRRGATNRRGPHFLNTVLDVCSNRGAKSEIARGAPISNGVPGTTAPPLATTLSG